MDAKKPAVKVTALITGRGESQKNLCAILGRYLCEYPIIAAKRAECVDDIYFSTDGDALKQMARKHDVEVIDRPPEMARADSPHVDCLLHALGVIQPPPDVLVVLLANVGIHHWGIIDRCVELLEANPDASAVVPVVKAREYAVNRAMGALPARSDDGMPIVFADDKLWYFTPHHFTPFPIDTYFLTHSVWALRVNKCFGATVGTPPWTFMGDCVLPLEVDCGGDIDCIEDARAAERWLITSGWNPELDMYETDRRYWRDFLPRG